MFQTTIGSKSCKFSRKRFSTLDSGRVRGGGQGPVFRQAAPTDAAAARSGAHGLQLRSLSIQDSGMVRIGGQAPLFR